MIFNFDGVISVQINDHHTPRTSIMQYHQWHVIKKLEKHLDDPTIRNALKELANMKEKQS